MSWHEQFCSDNATPTLEHSAESLKKSKVFHVDETGMRGDAQIIGFTMPVTTNLRTIPSHRNANCAKREIYLNVFSVTKRRLHDFMNMTFGDRIAANVRGTRNRIDVAARKSGRQGSDVTLVAVSKYAVTGDGMIEALVAAGCVDLGEARPQLLQEKSTFYSSYPIRWHLIGSLQRNKIRKIIAVTTLIHSLDSVRLAETINRIVQEKYDTENMPQNTEPVHCLLEIVVSGDAGKHGFTIHEIPETLEQLGKLQNIVVDGFMCMSGLESDEHKTRREFAAVRQLTELLRQQGTPPNIKLDILSMGMSGDFEIAVEEGATLVRIGSRLYQ
jgi:pyridoxal phosphate enzyme (YggS family)